MDYILMDCNKSKACRPVTRSLCCYLSSGPRFNTQPHTPQSHNDWYPATIASVPWQVQSAAVATAPHML